MVILVDERFAVSLREQDDLEGFKVVARHPQSEQAKVIGALEEIGARLGGEHAWIPEVWVRTAAGAKGAAWQTSFDGVVGYAKKKEWYDEATKSIRAHIEWATS